VAEGDLRLFIAVPLPPAALDASRSLIEDVRAGTTVRGVRWVRPDGLHVTLRFLGWTAPSQVEPVGKAIAAAIEHRAPFAVTLAGAGSFPDGKRPRTLWIGIRDGAAELADLARRLDAPLAALGWVPEGRPFRPHLTIARTDAAHGTDGVTVAGALADAATDWSVSFEASTVSLYQSHLGSGPARYEAIAEVPLGG
jgi:2'-5' RNA ligase